MIKLTNILNELLNTFEITAILISDKGTSTNDILDQIRALEKVTVIRNITPPEYMIQSNSSHTILTIKFITRGDVNKDIQNLKNKILTTSDSNLRIPGVKSFNYKMDTLKRL
jgi:ABC-type transporter Mla maintaining outer membrane lipid asymmetry ATPase subunit MlaF